ncbi:hypothetical protein POM88_001651 [Heracleum sosnowskyi]|uniref:SCP domain-containing protein n=1 Tax=Heracleum sosnowskyi TaxID=360622 RepID=A0AAD8NB16_9APIA|nr:hypothetical protein POM88_001651 [Heracleum sosnowskyi]
MALPKISAALFCALWLLMLHSCHALDTTLADPNRKNPSDKAPENNPKTPDDKTPQHRITDDKSKDDKTHDDKSQDNKSQDKKITDDKSKDDDKSEDDDDKCDDDDDDDDDDDKSQDDKTPHHKSKDDKTPHHKSQDHKTPHHKSHDGKTEHQKDKTSNKSYGKSEVHNTTKPPKDSEPTQTPKQNATQNPTQKAPQNPSNRGPQYPPQDWVDAHNAIRKTEGVVLMTWNESLADYAWNAVQKITPNCKDVHHSGGPWGECIFEGDGNATAKEIVDYWASEKEFWDPKTKKCQDGQDCGHYLQVVNPNSPALGCAKAKCANDPFYWIDICNYIW